MKQYQGGRFALLIRISELHFLWTEELPQLNDLLYMHTGMGCLSYGHGGVLTVA